MASNTENKVQICNEFKDLKLLFDEIKASHFANQSSFSEISMGMSSDYLIAVQEGSTLVRVGSLIFGDRQYTIN